VDYSRTFSYELPTKIEFGMGISERVAERVEEYGGSKVLLVADPGVLAAGVVDKVTDSLRNASVPYVVFSDIEPEPEARSIVEGVERARSEGCEVVVGIGGGSALDSAKAIAVMLKNEGHIRDYVGQNLVPNPGVPTITLPTTAGTGSEVTIWSVISEKEEKAKYGVGSPYMTATVAMCDPELTLTLPPHLTASTGMDALAHALESYVNKTTQPISEALSIRAMELIAKSLRTAVAAGENLQARSDMLLASLLAALAMNPTRLGLAHALVMPIGANYKIPHSVGVAILLPEVMRYNLIGNLEKFVTIARIFGENTEGLSLRDAAELSVKAIRQLSEDVGIPGGLARYGVEDERLYDLAEAGIATGNVPVNPREPTVEDLVGIMRRCMGNADGQASLPEDR
jgi:alcohol dehydrogenase class IV